MSRWIITVGFERIDWRNEREPQSNDSSNVARRDLHGRRVRTESRPGRLRRGVVASQEARRSQRRLSFDHQPPDGNPRPLLSQKAQVVRCVSTVAAWRLCVECPCGSHLQCLCGSFDKGSEMKSDRHQYSMADILIASVGALAGGRCSAAGNRSRAVAKPKLIGNAEVKTTALVPGADAQLMSRLRVNLVSLLRFETAIGRLAAKPQTGKLLP